MEPDASVVVIGAGPHGLAAVAHMRASGVPAVGFGDPLAFWRDTMPNGMVLRSSPRASSISDPDGRLSFGRWAAENGREIRATVPIGDFIEYGRWFQRSAAPDIDRRLVTRVRRRDGRFAVTLQDGDELTASRVVVAAGLGPFAHVPAVFHGLPESLRSHASERPPLEAFAGRSVAVVGGGQSALEGAALLAEADADVEVLVRARAIFWLKHGWRRDVPPSKPTATLPPTPSPTPTPATPTPAPSWRARNGIYWHAAPTEVGGRLSSWVGAAPDVCRLLPRRVRSPLTYHCIRPAAAWWLPDRLRTVTFTLGRTVVATEPRGEKALLRLDDGSERLVDHVMLGTGYRIDVSRYPFLARELVRGLRVARGSPILGRGLESSVPGLHFVGAPAAESFGPVMRFVVGTAYTAPALAQYARGCRRPVFRWAF
jgi:hypothetical protein